MLPSHVVLDPKVLYPERIRPLKRVEYERMVELGLFEDERVELLAGQLIEMSPQGEPHAFVVAELGARLTVALFERARVRQHSPLAVSEDSVPEPDIALVPLTSAGSSRPFWAHLVIEVSDSSLRKDRAAKGLVYAAAGIPEYWIVNLNDGVLEVYTDPSPSGYQTRETVDRDAEVAARAFPEAVLRVGDFLPEGR